MICLVIANNKFYIFTDILFLKILNLLGLVGTNFSCSPYILLAMHQISLQIDSRSTRIAQCSWFIMVSKTYTYSLYLVSFLVVYLTEIAAQDTREKLYKIANPSGLGGILVSVSRYFISYRLRFQSTLIL